MYPAHRQSAFGRLSLLIGIAIGVIHLFADLAPRPVEYVSTAPTQVMVVQRGLSVTLHHFDDVCLIDHAIPCWTEVSTVTAEVYPYENVSVCQYYTRVRPEPTVGPLGH